MKIQNRAEAGANNLSGVHVSGVLMQHISTRSLFLKHTILPKIIGTFTVFNRK